MIILNVFVTDFGPSTKEVSWKFQKTGPCSAYMANVQLTTSVDLNTALNVESCLSL